MDVVPLTLEYYHTASGRQPFRDWLLALDNSARRIVHQRLARLRKGLLGDSEHLGGGLWEIRLDTGPGYRIYIGRAGRTIIVLITGGIKKGQQADIDLARALWADHLRRTNA